MIVVTGMHRSGTSCITGLLSLCGFSLGTSHPLLNEARQDNEKGHFENLIPVAINEKILRSAGGSWANPPMEGTIFEAGLTFAGEIRQFLETFDGDMFKDPRMCLTISTWEKLSPGSLGTVILCLRHPMSVAMSLQRRNSIQIRTGLEIWTRYNASMMKAVSRIQPIVVDYDNLRANLLFELGCLTRKLGKILPDEELVRLTDGFYSEGLNHAPIEQSRDFCMPPQTEALYQAIYAMTFSVSKMDGEVQRGRSRTSKTSCPRGKKLSQILSSPARRISKAINYLRS